MVPRQEARDEKALQPMERRGRRGWDARLDLKEGLRRWC